MNNKKKNICDSIDDQYSITKELKVPGVGDVIIVAYPSPDMHQFINLEQKIPLHNSIISKNIKIIKIFVCNLYFVKFWRID